MQKGIATLEIIFIMLITSFLASVTIPHTVKVIDEVALDYETKKFYTDLKFLQAFDRMTNMKDTHFGTNDEKSVMSLEIPNEKTSYIITNRNSNKFYGKHLLPKNFSFDYERTDDFSYIKFDDMGKARAMNSSDNPRGKALDGHIKIGSQFDKNFFLVVNSVGRIRGSRVRPDEQNR